MKKFALFCLSLAAIPAAYAGSKLAAPVTTLEFDPFARGSRETAQTVGFFYSPVLARKGRPGLHYAQINQTFGWMLASPSAPWGATWLRGNWEALANLCGMAVVSGPSGFLAGGRALIRYNFVQPEARWVPFVQLGAGVLGNNVYRNRDQRLIGSGVEFTLVADAGVRYFFTPRWAAILTADFEHISNANTASRNYGVNALGGMAGAAFFF